MLTSPSTHVDYETYKNTVSEQLGQDCLKDHKHEPSVSMCTCDIDDDDIMLTSGTLGQDCLNTP